MFRRGVVQHPRCIYVCVGAFTAQGIVVGLASVSTIRGYESPGALCTLIYSVHLISTLSSLGSSMAILAKCKFSTERSYTFSVDLHHDPKYLWISCLLLRK